MTSISGLEKLSQKRESSHLLRLSGRRKVENTNVMSRRVDRLLILVNLKKYCCLVTTTILIGTFIGCAKTEIAVPQSSEVIIELYSRLSSKPLSSSPNLKFTAFSSGKPTKPYGIEIKSASRGEPIASFYTSEAILRATWSPDSNVLAYFRQHEDSTRSLFFWDIRSDQHHQVPTPVTHNQYEVKWSPDTKFLAFLSDEKELVIVRQGAAITRVQGWFRSFSWSSDSSRIALVLDSRSERHDIAIFDMKTGLTETNTISPDWNLVSLEWEPYADILITTQNREKSRSALFAFNPAEKKVVNITDTRGEVSFARRIFEGGDYIWTSQDKGSYRQIEIVKGNADMVFRTKFDGNCSLLNLSPDRRSISFSVASPRQIGLYKFDLANPDATMSAIAETKGKSLGRQTIWPIQVSTGETLNIEISEPADSIRNTNTYLVRMLGGSTPDFIGNWAERQLYTQYGVTYIAVPNRKPHGPRYLIEVCRHLKDVRGADEKRIVVIGESTAANIVLTAAMQSHGFFGTAVIVGLTDPPARLPLTNFSGCRLLAFHGEVDPFPYQRTYQMLVKYLGADALKSPNGFWHVVPGEPHALNVSNGLVHATILSLLGINYECQDETP